MSKKIVSVILAAVLAGVVVPALPAVEASAGNQGIWFNPSDPDASGSVKEDTLLYAEASEGSTVVGFMAKGTFVDLEEKTTDLNGVEWVKIKEHKGSNDVVGYTKASNFNEFYY